MNTSILETLWPTVAASGGARSLLEGSARRWLSGFTKVLPQVLWHPVHLPAALRGWADSRLYDAHV
ncbi:MAG: hypothetical protein ACLP4V_26905 [Methylocella sp.]